MTFRSFIRCFRRVNVERPRSVLAVCRSAAIILLSNRHGTPRVGRHWSCPLPDLSGGNGWLFLVWDAFARWLAVHVSIDWNAVRRNSELRGGRRWREHHLEIRHLLVRTMTRVDRLRSAGCFPFASLPLILCSTNARVGFSEITDRYASAPQRVRRARGVQLEIDVENYGESALNIQDTRLGETEEQSIEKLDHGRAFPYRRIRYHRHTSKSAARQCAASARSHQYRE